MLKKMLKEEWRTHASMYDGNYFKAFPFLLLGLTLTGAYSAINYGSTQIYEIGRLMVVFGFFTGLAAGTVGFSSKDAYKNLLGSVNFLIYSSRTLPIKKKTLMINFIAKDLIYYIAVFLLPITLGVYIVSGRVILIYALGMLSMFITGLGTSILLAKASIKLPNIKMMSYSNFKLDPLTKKTLIDLTRSTGGFFKIIFSLTVLLGFYWYVVLNFRSAQYLLQNPLNSFAVLLAMMSLTVYNWINTYDKFKDYRHLPFTPADLIKSKMRAYMFITTFLIIVTLSVSYSYYPGSIITAILIAISSNIYVLGAISYVTGLKPNEKMMDAKEYTKVLIAINTVLAPILIYTVFYNNFNVILGIALVTAVIGIALIEETMQNYQNKVQEN